MIIFHLVGIPYHYSLVEEDYIRIIKAYELELRLYKSIQNGQTILGSSIMKFPKGANAKLRAIFAAKTLSYLPPLKRKWINITKNLKRHKFDIFVAFLNRAYSSKALGGHFGPSLLVALVLIQLLRLWTL